MSTQVVEERGGSTTVQAYVRGQRALVRIQLIIGLIALLGVAFVGWRLWDWRNTLVAQQEELAEQQTQINQQNARIARFTAAAVPFQNGQIALGRGPEQYPFALAQLQQALLISRDQERGEDEPAFLRGLVAAQFKMELYNDAAENGARLVRIEGVPDEDRLDDSVNLAAAYFCLGNTEAAMQLAGDERVRARLQGNSCVPASALGVTETASAESSAFRIQLIYLHIAQESDRDEARALAAVLRDGGYRVAGIELVESASYPSALDLRYYYEPQATQAQEISSLLQRSAGETSGAPQTWAAAARVRQLTGYPDLPRDRVEIWLPRGPAAPAAPTPQPNPTPVP